MTPRGIRNNNPGNIRPGQGFKGECGAQDGYAIFVTPELGMRAIAVDLLTKFKHGLDTVTKIITRYAPPEDQNDTAAYIRCVAHDVGVRPDDALDLHVPITLALFVRAIIMHENGQCPYALDAITDAVDLALGVPA